MVFDRNAINTGRRIQDFGLCDLAGVYQNTAKMRAKGYLVVAFLKAGDPNSASAAKQLQDWTSIGDKVSVVAVVIGERADVEKMVQDTGVTYPVLWDFETYVAPLWAVSAVPTLFVTDDQGVVLARVAGSDPRELSAAKDLLAETVRKADEAAKAAAEAAAAAQAAAPDPKQGGSPAPVAPSPAGAPAAAKA